MSRSLKVKQDSLEKVRLALIGNSFPTQRSLAEEIGFSLATVSNFLNGKSVDYKTFVELCQRLALDPKEIAVSDGEISFQTKTSQSSDEIPDIEPACYPTGAIHRCSPFYLERIPFEEQIKQEIKKPGALIRIKAPKEMGKTSLLLRVLDFAKSLGYHTVRLNIDQVDQKILSNLNQFLRWICANVSRQLDLKPCLDNYWDEDLGSKISCSAYFQDYILENITTPIILSMDEVNQLFEHPEITKDFLPLLRSWYEEAKTMPIWQKLRLIVVHSTEIYVPLALNQSPFNVGLPIYLNYFSKKQVQELAERYRIDWMKEEETEQLISMVGGHPALVHIALYHLSHDKVTLKELLASASTSNGIYFHHLHRHGMVLREEPQLASVLHAIIRNENFRERDFISVYKLSSMGLVKLDNNRITLSCQLYRQYLNYHFYNK